MKMKKTLHHCGHVFVVLLLSGVAYRTRLHTGQTGPELARDHLPGQLLSDLLAAGAVTFALAPLLIALAALGGRFSALARPAAAAGHAGTMLVITLAAVITQFHLALLSLTRSGLTFDLLQEGSTRG